MKKTGIVVEFKSILLLWRVCCSSGGIGRRAWLRAMWSNPWGFKSPLEHHKTWLTGSDAHVAQSVERILGKDEVTGSNPVVGSSFHQVGESREFDKIKN